MGVRVANNEQWESGGDCDICRRSNYCKQTCKAANAKARYELNQIMHQAMRRVCGHYFT